jgi:YHS domain-containing protein
VLDPDHRSFVNWETFFFADLDSKKKFDADPLRYCGILTDPVTHLRFEPGSRSPSSQYDGRPYFFYSGENKAKFDADPATYAKVNADWVTRM